MRWSLARLPMRPGTSPRQADVTRISRPAFIMARFEDILASHDDQQASTAKLCAAIGVQQRTLRACCAKFIAMSPRDYLRLRRLNPVRAALRRADPETTGIAVVARRFGFSVLGRFTTAFGEASSITRDGYSKIRHVVPPYVRKRREHAASGFVPARTVARQRARADDFHDDRARNHPSRS